MSEGQRGSEEEVHSCDDTGQVWVHPDTGWYKIDATYLKNQARIASKMILFVAEFISLLPRELQKSVTEIKKNNEDSWTQLLSRQLAVVSVSHNTWKSDGLTQLEDTWLQTMMAVGFYYSHCDRLPLTLFPFPDRLYSKVSDCLSSPLVSICTPPNTPRGWRVRLTDR